MARRSEVKDRNAELKMASGITSGFVFQNVGEASAAKQEENTDVRYLEDSKIKDSPFNEGMDPGEMESLAKSMEENGLYDPILVYELPDGMYEIVSGHRRRYAWCKINQNPTIRAIVIPYEKDIEKRFRRHTEANTETRSKDSAFWSSRIRIALEIIHTQGFDGSREEEQKKVSDMIGISRTDFYRFRDFDRLFSGLRAFEKKGWLSGQTLSIAKCLDIGQQEALADRICAEADAAIAQGDEFEITREKFQRLVNRIRAGENPETTGASKKKTYAEKVKKSFSDSCRILGNARSDEERGEALLLIQKMRSRLDEIEQLLKS